jgi:hypothetical protein
MESKTPMQELIDDLQDNEPKYYERNYNFLHNLLEKEKRVIEDAFNQGYREGFSDAQSVTENDKDISEFDDAQNYYNNKFKND